MPAFENSCQDKKKPADLSIRFRRGLAGVVTGKLLPHSRKSIPGTRRLNSEHLGIPGATFLKCSFDKFACTGTYCAHTSYGTKIHQGKHKGSAGPGTFIQSADFIRS